ncbi:hypothetical protein AMJ44_03945 [candidate division WOR-1 bacterium DG_54_3]|uniref:Uncharacterized protein n=1 Tax=candidate division WOR-1 bacterium DG_54_3 TaxID=1703775 RepID=A0A0S7Y3Y9_UNCSA|nr:MAG: hypothetical protein AMJ44_03945 [candidate division WOR-1 bacterium DG_54_3]
MIPRISRPISVEINRIGKQVSLVEGSLENKKFVRPYPARKVAYWLTSAPNQGIYLRSDLQKLSTLLENSKFNDKAACVLGSGLGGAAFVLKIFFNKVVGWEDDPIFLNKSLEIQTKLGEPYDKVKFYREDFLSDKADISTFPFIYFYEPFLDDFDKFMGEKLLKASKGTIIICPELTEDSLYPMVFPETSFIQHLSSCTVPKKSEFDVFERI